MKVKRKEWEKLNRELQAVNKILRMRIKLVIPGEKQPKDIMNVSVDELYMIQKYGGYGYFLGSLYGVEIPLVPEDWIHGPVKLVVESTEGG